MSANFKRPTKIYCFLLVLFITAFSSQTQAQCSTHNEGLGISWSIASGGGSDKAIISIYSDATASDCENAEITIKLAQQLSSSATVNADFSGGWLYQSGSGSAFINSGGTEISANYSRSTCNPKSGNGFLCEIFLDNHGASLKLDALISGGGGVILLEDLN